MSEGVLMAVNLNHKRTILPAIQDKLVATFCQSSSMCVCVCFWLGMPRCLSNKGTLFCWNIDVHRCRCTHDQRHPIVNRTRACVHYSAMPTSSPPPVLHLWPVALHVLSWIAKKNVSFDNRWWRSPIKSRSDGFRSGGLYERQTVRCRVSVSL